MSEIRVIKASGDKVVFDENKLRVSLERAGASDHDIDEIVEKINQSIYDGISTKEIYQSAFNLLKNKNKGQAGRYKLKKAIIELGPTGYPFEDYFSELLKYQGYKVKVGQNVKGHCVKHEVDVIAEKGNKHFMIECKFHSDQNRKCDVKVPLYINSRFHDVKRAWEKKEGHTEKFHQGWIVTNTRFTDDAKQYGNCINLHLIGWSYPKSGSLKERIDVSGLYPITCLSTLQRKEKQALLDQNIVLCRDLCDNEDRLRSLNISSRRIKNIIDEANELCRLC